MNYSNKLILFASFFLHVVFFNGNLFFSSFVLLFQLFNTLNFLIDFINFILLQTNERLKLYCATEYKIKKKIYFTSASG